MAEYDIYENEIVRNITVQRNIHRFRHFMYSQNKESRQSIFRSIKEFFETEYNNPSIISTERERLLNLRNHWQWSMFDDDSTRWWSTLSSNHSTSLTLMIAIRAWADGHTYF